MAETTLQTHVIMPVRWPSCTAARGCTCMSWQEASTMIGVAPQALGALARLPLWEVRLHQTVDRQHYDEVHGDADQQKAEQNIQEVPAEWAARVAAPGFSWWALGVGHRRRRPCCRLDRPAHPPTPACPYLNTDCRIVNCSSPKVPLRSPKMTPTSGVSQSATSALQQRAGRALISF